MRCCCPCVNFPLWRCFAFDALRCSLPIHATVVRVLRCTGVLACSTRAHRWVIGYVCHEMRNPLHVLKACLAVLLERGRGALGPAAVDPTVAGTGVVSMGTRMGGPPALASAIGPDRHRGLDGNSDNGSVNLDRYQHAVSCWP
jgi:hypothetical protein